MSAPRSTRWLAESRFRGTRARTLFAGLTAHSTLPLEGPLSAGVGLVLAICARSAGWPFPRGGAQRIADALAGYLRTLGGQVVTRYAGDHTSRSAGRDQRPDAAPDARAGWRPFPREFPGGAGALSLRSGRIHGGLGTRGS